VNLQGSISSLEKVLVLPPLEISDFGSRYPDPRGSIEFPGNSAGKSQALCWESNSVALVLWLCCDITVTIVKAKDSWKYLKGKIRLVVE